MTKTKDFQVYIKQIYIRNCFYINKKKKSFC